ncbi:MAG: phosphatidylglycerophosphatase A [Betaproteobacteria bacterium]|nr:phosphatidylglycerophosphatase A [Betaproteobacteria bacterium]
MPADSTISRRPDVRFLLAHPAHFIALGFGAGLSPVAPGTAGTAAALLGYFALATFLPPLVIAFLAIPLFFVGVWACGVAGRNLGVEDHGAFVWDEIVAFLPLAALASSSLALQALAFALFRFFDIWKPFPIRQFEKRVRGGFGVMLDDLLAACYAYLCFALIVLFAHRPLGLA